MILFILDFAGVVVFSVSGALAAGRKQLDILGVAVVAVVTAIGGGTLRDLLLNRHPVFWIQNPRYLLVILAATAATILYSRFRYPPSKALLVADACGLALVSISGAQLAEQSTSSGLIIIVMGTMTGVAGGVLRDVLLAEIPIIFRPGTIYATTAIAGIATYLLLHRLGLERAVAGVIGMGAIAILRLAAITWGLSLPVFSLPEHDPPPPRPK